MNGVIDTMEFRPSKTIHCDLTGTKDPRWFPSGVFAWRDEVDSFDLCCDLSVWSTLPIGMTLQFSPESVS